MAVEVDYRSTTKTHNEAVAIRVHDGHLFLLDSPRPDADILGAYAPQQWSRARVVTS
ncbi:hypothetical protein [Lentzea sp. NPDC004782]|uniref:hypothetical protein n=1 Tax=Lentzea sp. NPDC004782 TaxID=3154458 RepID=UPI0033AC8A03